MQKACKELKRKIEKAKTSTLPQTKEVLKEYKKNPTPELKRKAVELLQNAKEKTKQKKRKTTQEVVRKTKELLQEHPHSDEFEGKLKSEEGKIVVKGGLNFAFQEQIYLPSVIDIFEGTIKLNNLVSANNLNLPDIVDGHLWLNNLTSAESLDLPDKVRGTLALSNLTSAKHLDLPNIVRATLDLSSLESAEHLELPDTVGRILDLRSLTSAENLDLSKVNIEGEIYLDSLSQKERDELKEKYPQYKPQITTS